MKNWKISKLRIQGFKAFSIVDFDLAACSLVTLEGPNGYGKTTVFDAIELLFTGKISRIAKLFEAVMSGRQKNYRDNLYWNTKGGQQTLCIKAELVNESGDTLAFARVAQIDDLLNQANNRADKFEIFTLYELDTFEADNFDKPLSSQHLDQYFDKNFCQNYPMLNYLQQGQSAFIFATTILDRKAALETLLDTTALRTQIDRCGKVERKLAQINSEAEKRKTAELAAHIESLAKLATLDEFTEGYEAITTRVPPPEWDVSSPFIQVDSERYARLIANVDLLHELSKNKQEIRARKRNLEIEKYIVDKDSLISLAISIGKHTQRLDTLQLEKDRLGVLAKVLSVIDKGGKSITVEDLAVISAVSGDLDPALPGHIASRDSVAKQLSDKSVQIVELQRIRADLWKKHIHANGADTKWCPMCGMDWEAVERLVSAIDQTTTLINNEQGELTDQLAKEIDYIQKLTAQVRSALSLEKASLDEKFESALYEQLAKNKQSIDALGRFNERLIAQNIDYDNSFTVDALELASRKERLLAKLRALKSSEGEAPPAGWELVLQNAFATDDDFYKLEPVQYEKKRRYIELQHRQQQNTALQNAKRELRTRQQRAEAVTRAKTKISALKTALVKTEKDYSARTIGDIELIFHIYSGRLIQNYQRGLGLFIDQGEGNKVQFCTAEQSEHDATLSMSSGQLCALSLAFFLSLNRVYSKTPFVLIDDPAQSLDEINIASLTDLLRCELRDRQLIMSSHEDDIAAYMRYRFLRAGLTQKPFHMQLHLENSVAQAQAS